jgi:hypothetical protein
MTVYVCLLVRLNLRERRSEAHYVRIYFYGSAFVLALKA